MGQVKGLAQVDVCAPPDELHFFPMNTTEENLNNLNQPTSLMLWKKLNSHGANFSNAMP
jgi:hypothetical protein